MSGTPRKYRLTESGCSRRLPSASKARLQQSPAPLQSDSVSKTTRDGGRCAFVGTRRRCRETIFLEFHHVEPYSVGGDATADNIALRCRAHNTHEARLYFGEPPSEQAVTTHHE